MVDSIPAGAWAALTAIAGAVIGWLTSRPKAKAEAAEVLTTSALTIVQELQEEIVRLRAQADESERRAEEFRVENRELRKELNGRR